MGGLQLPTAQPNPMAFFPEQPPRPSKYPCFNMWKNESELLSLTDTESLSRKEPELLSRLEGILLKFMNFHPMLVHSVGTRPNQRGRDKMETRFDKWTNSRGFDFIHSVSVVDYRSCPLSGSWLEELYMI